MSDVFDLDTEGQQALAAEARSNAIPLDQVGSGFWHSVPTAIGMGVMRGGARAAQAVGLAGGGLLSLFEDKPGDLTDPYFRAMDHYIGDAVDYWTPGANEVGTAGRILGGFSEMALPLMAGGGNPSLLIGSAELGGAQDLVKQGASAEGAAAGGIIQGLATAAGFRIPFLGKTLASRIGSGIAGNVAVNAGGQLATKLALRATGDKAQAEAINPLDLEARLVDVLSGALFGGLAHLASPSVRDAAATTANAKHFQEDTAPGVPRGIEDSVAHQAAMEESIRATLEGRPVDLSNTGVQDAEFIALPRPFGHLAETPEELKGVDEALKPEPTQAEQIAQADMPESSRAQLARMYADAANVKPGFDATLRNIARDIGSPHEPKIPEGLKGVGRAVEKTMDDYGGDASQLKDIVRGTVVADDVPQALRALESVSQRLGEPFGVRNSLLPDSKASPEGYRDIKANVLVNGHVSEVQINVPEMLEAKDKHGHDLYKEYRQIQGRVTKEGRDPTVTEAKRLDELLAKQQKIYAAAWDAFLARVRNSDSDTNAPLRVKDENGNRRPSGTSQARQTQAGVSEQGTPSTSANLVPSGNEAGKDIATTSGQSIPEPGAKVSDPIVMAANQLLTESDFPIPTGEIDANGNPVYRSAREVMAESQAAVTQAQHDAKAFDALAGCILTRGDG